MAGLRRPKVPLYGCAGLDRRVADLALEQRATEPDIAHGNRRDAGIRLAEALHRVQVVRNAQAELAGAEVHRRAGPQDIRPASTQVVQCRRTSREREQDRVGLRVVKHPGTGIGDAHPIDVVARLQSQRLGGHVQPWLNAHGPEDVSGTATERGERRRAFGQREENRVVQRTITKRVHGRRRLFVQSIKVVRVREFGQSKRMARRAGAFDTIAVEEEDIRRIRIGREFVGLRLCGRAGGLLSDAAAA